MVLLILAFLYFFVVPFMFWSFKLLGTPQAVLMHLAIGTSLVIMVVTALNTTYQHHQKGTIHWTVFFQLLSYFAWLL